MTADLAMDVARRGPGMFELFKHEHAAPLAEQEAVAIAVKRPARAGGIIIAGRHRGQENEAGEAERMDHAVRAPRQDHVGRAAANHLDRLTDRLGAGRAGRQTCGVVATGTENPGEIAGGRTRLLLGLANWVQHLNPQSREEPPVNLSAPGRAMNEVDEGRKVLLPFPRAQVNAESSRFHVAAGLQARRGPWPWSQRPGRIELRGSGRASAGHRCGSHRARNL